LEFQRQMFGQMQEFQRHVLGHMREQNRVTDNMWAWMMMPAVPREPHEPGTMT